jgi:hypothetical protein
MNIIEAFRLALDTGGKIESRWGVQYAVTTLDRMVMDISVDEILADDWKLVEEHNLKKAISQGAIRKACAEKCFAPFVAEAIIDALWPKP